MNWRGTPLVDVNTIVSLIGSTHSRAGLQLHHSPRDAMTALTVIP